MECVCSTAPAARAATISRCSAVSADALPSPLSTRPSPYSRMSSGVRSPLCVPLRVIASRSGSRLSTALKLPLVPSTQPRASNRRPMRMSSASTGTREFYDKLDRMRTHKGMVVACALAIAAGAVLVAQGGRGQGRGFGPSEVVPIKAGEQCPPGMTEFRHLQCARPAAPPPSIVDYRPRSTVVAEEHLVPKAKFPVVDVHTHNTAAFVN